MSELFDFLIELLYSITGGVFSYKKQFQSAIEVPQDDRILLLDRLHAHLSKDPATANLEFDNIYIEKSMRGTKMVLLDSEYRKVHSILFSISLNSNWKTGKISDIEH